MKKISMLFMALLLGVGGVSAKTSTTTLWEDSYTGNIEIPVANLVQGATITVNATVTESTTADDRKLRIFYCKNDDNWSQTSFSDISDWVELAEGEVSYSFTVTEAAMNILNDNTEITGSRGVMYIGANNDGYVSITKITQTETLEPTLTGNNLLSVDLEPTAVPYTFDALAGAKIGDVILFDVSLVNGNLPDWGWAEFYVRDKDGNDFSNVGHYTKSFFDNTDETYEYEITNIADLKKIRANGFSVLVQSHCKITSIKLLSYKDSRDVVTITIPAVGYATWSSDKKYDFATAGLQAYYASEVAEGSVTLTPMDITWDWQGYIIKGSEGEYDVIQSLTEDGTYYPSTNYLKENITAKEVYDSEKNRYIFAMKNGDTSSFGFYKLTAAHTLAAHKAYLETPTDITPSAGARVALVFSDEAETTGISASLGEKVENASEHIYNLRGMRVTQPQKGLYIKNGKKMIIR